MAVVKLLLGLQALVIAVDVSTCLRQTALKPLFSIYLGHSVMIVSSVKATFVTLLNLNPNANAVTALFFVLATCCH